MSSSPDFQKQQKINALMTYAETGWNMFQAAVGLYAIAMISAHGFHINPHEILPQTIEAVRHIYDTAANIGEQAILETIPFIGGLVAGFFMNDWLMESTFKKLEKVLVSGTGVATSKSTHRVVTQVSCKDPDRVDTKGKSIVGGGALQGALPAAVLWAGFISNHFTGPVAAFSTGLALTSNIKTAVYAYKGQMNIVKEQVMFDRATEPGRQTALYVKSHGDRCKANGITNLLSFGLNETHNKLGRIVTDLVAIPSVVMGYITVSGVLSPIVAKKYNGQAVLSHSSIPSKIVRKN